jgi:hypothetical protein
LMLITRRSLAAPTEASATRRNLPSFILTLEFQAVPTLVCHFLTFKFLASSHTNMMLLCTAQRVPSKHQLSFVPKDRVRCLINIECPPPFEQAPTGELNCGNDTPGLPSLLLPVLAPPVPVPGRFRDQFSHLQTGLATKLPAASPAVALSCPVPAHTRPPLCRRCSCLSWPCARCLNPT